MDRGNYRMVRGNEDESSLRDLVDPLLRQVGTGVPRELRTVEYRHKQDTVLRKRNAVGGKTATQRTFFANSYASETSSAWRCFSRVESVLGRTIAL